MADEPIDPKVQGLEDDSDFHAATRIMTADRLNSGDAEGPFQPTPAAGIPAHDPPSEEADPAFSPPPAGTIRTLIGGGLMGVANIIPGVSGGTMILASGLYDNFVEAVADISRFHFRRQSLTFLVLLGIGVVLGIGGMVFPITWGLEHFHHLMFALFIGLTLGGAPLLWHRMKPHTGIGFVFTAIGLGLMAFISYVLQTTQLPANWIFFFIGGIFGAAAMVLPGISGSYLLLIFGLYTPVTTGIKDWISAVKNVDIGLVMDLSISLMLPVGLGVLVGIATLTNVLRKALHHFNEATMGFLLGLLLGSVFALNPFRAPDEKDEFVEAAALTGGNIALVAICIIAGFAITWFISSFGEEHPIKEESAAA